MADSKKTAKPRRELGRPTEMTGGKRVNLYLDAASLERAAQLGDGNVSEGVRRALAKVKPPKASS